MLYIRRNQGIYVTVFSWCIVIGVIIALVLGILCDLKGNGIIVLLPVTYIACFFVCVPNRQYLNCLSLSIINIIAVFRYIIYPIIIIITIHSGGHYPFDNNCVWILIYEMIGVFFVISLFARKIGKPVKNRFQNDAKIGVPNLLLMLALIPIFIMFPSLLTRFSISSQVKKVASTIGAIEVVLSMGIWTLFIFLITRVTIETKYRLFRFLWVGVIAVYYVMFNAVSGSDVKRWQIISCGCAMLYITINLYPDKKKMIIYFGIVGIAVSVILGSLIKFGARGSLSVIVGKYFDIFHFTEYFGGMKNITSALEMASQNASIHNFQMLLTDLFSGMPIISSLFNYDKNSIITMFQRFVSRTDIICPLTAQSVIYFGVIGTPVLAMLMTYLAIELNRALNRTRSYYSAYVLVELVVWFSLFMGLNTTIILGKMWIRLIFLALQPIDRATAIKLHWGEGA